MPEILLGIISKPCVKNLPKAWEEDAEASCRNNQSSTGEIRWFPVPQDPLCILPLLSLELFMSGCISWPLCRPKTLCLWNRDSGRNNALFRRQKDEPARAFYTAICWKNNSLSVRETISGSLVWEDFIAVMFLLKDNQGGQFFVSFLSRHKKEILPVAQNIRRVFGW